MRRVLVQFLAVLAAVGALVVDGSAASAAEGTFTVSTGTTSFTGSQTESGRTLTLTGGRVVRCSTATFSGTIANGSKSLHSSQAFSGCSTSVAGSILPTTFIELGCDYEQRDLTTIGPDTYSAVSDVDCPAGHPYIIVTYSSQANHTAGTRLCEYKIDSQSNLPGAEVTNNTNGTATVNLVNVPLHTTRTFGTIANCGEETFTTFDNGSVLITAGAGDFGLDD